MANTIVEYMHEHGGYRCGYCGGSNTNFSHGMWAHSLSSQDYQDLLDRGWRRSGCYLYKPLMDKMCCPCYTIRCAALEYKPSNSQKKVIKKVIRFLSTGERPSSNLKSSEDVSHDEQGIDCPGTSEHPAQEQELRKQMTAAAVTVSSSPVNTAINSATENAECARKSDSHVDRAESEQIDQEVGPGINDNDDNPKKTGGASLAKKHPKPGIGADLTKPPCKKAKELRRQRRLERLSQTGTDAPATDKKQLNQPKSLEELFQEVERASHGSKHKLEMRYVRSSPMNPEFENTFKESYRLYHRYQVTIHKDPPSKPSEKQFKLVRASTESREFRETFKASHQVFAKYQTTIHKEPDEECEEEDFKRFLVDSPLREEHLPGAPECGYGSFHEHFLLDGQIIAVGVLDVLPGCISSVYFYYDPNYSFLSLGTYSALRELEFTRLLHRECPHIDYYYMGFYIHSCVKMRYKGQYYPSFLLCPEAFTWCPLEKCLPKLVASKYARLDETGKVDTPINLPDVRILHMQMSMRYSDYHRFAPNADDDEEVQEYAQYVGKTCAGRMLLYRH